MGIKFFKIIKLWVGAEADSCRGDIDLYLLLVWTTSNVDG